LAVRLCFNNANHLFPFLSLPNLIPVIDAKFRDEVFKRKGMEKGNITEALEEGFC